MTCPESSRGKVQRRPRLFRSIRSHSTPPGCSGTGYRPKRAEGNALDEIIHAVDFARAVEYLFTTHLPAPDGFFSYGLAALDPDPVPPL